MVEREIGRLEGFMDASLKWQEKADERLSAIELYMAELKAERSTNTRWAAGAGAAVAAFVSFVANWAVDWFGK